MTKTALIVEDSKISALAIRKALSEAGYDEIVIINDGADALNKYKELMPNVITMDINMPEVDGINATRQIFSFDANAHIIVITELQLSEEKKKELDGVVEIIFKPVTVAKIHAALAKM